MDYYLIQSLVEKSYNRFKAEYPNEEPYFRITCTRRWKEDMGFWRAGVEGKKIMRVVSQERKISRHEITPEAVLLDEGVKVNSKLERQIEAFKKANENNASGRGLPTRRIKIKDKDKTVIHSTKFAYDASVDVRFDNPITVSSFKYKMDRLYKRMEELREEYKVYFDDPLFTSKFEMFNTSGPVGTIDERLDRTIKRTLDLKSKEAIKYEIDVNIPKVSELTDATTNTDNVFIFDEKKSLLDVETQSDATSMVCEDCAEAIATVSVAFKDEVTIRDLAVKYVDLQRKLNVLKSFVVPMMKRIKRIDFLMMIKQIGFIKTIKNFIMYLENEHDVDQIYDVSSDYEDN